MNSLSWLIYLISVFSGLKLAAILALVIFLISLIVVTFCWAAAESDDNDIVEKLSLYMKKIFLYVFISVVVIVIVPGERTMYMIAASEVGQRIVEQPESQEIVSEVHSIILEKLKELRSSPNSEK